MSREGRQQQRSSSTGDAPLAETLASLIILARAQGLDSISAETSDYGRASFNFHASAYAAAPALEGKPAADADICHCGHSHEIEHNGDGLCLQGCAVETCAGVGALAEAAK